MLQGNFDTEKIADIVRDIRITLEESEQNGLTIDDNGVWYKDGKRLEES